MNSPTQRRQWETGKYGLMNEWTNGRCKRTYTITGRANSLAITIHRSNYPTANIFSAFILLNFRFVRHRTLPFQRLFPLPRYPADWKTTHCIQPFEHLNWAFCRNSAETIFWTNFMSFAVNCAAISPPFFSLYLRTARYSGHFVNSMWINNSNYYWWISIFNTFNIYKCDVCSVRDIDIASLTLHNSDETPWTVLIVSALGMFVYSKSGRNRNTS